MENDTRVFVGILHIGEAEFSACLDSISSQLGVVAECFVISDKPNKDAHDELYSTFMSRSTAFDYFFKLDADMTLRSPDALRALVSTVRSKGAAHALSYVFDHPSSLAIPGVQIFRSDSRWEGSDEQLNVDYPPRLTGESMLIIDPIYVDHMSSPSQYQLFRYGIHKALKAIQHGRGAKKSVQKGLLHSAIINGMARNFVSGRQDLVWALIGARLVFDGGVPSKGYHSEEVKAIYSQIESDAALFQQLSEEAGRFFGNEVQNWFRWINQFQST
jgi:hypothetical protein